MIQNSSASAIKPNTGFPTKLFLLLDDIQCTSLKWNNHGNAAIILCNEFKKELITDTQLKLKYHLKTSSVTSFVRQLHAYGFRKVNEESDEFGPEKSIQRCYSHPCFQKNRPELLAKLKRGSRKKIPSRDSDSNSVPGSPTAHRLSQQGGSGIIGENTASFGMRRSATHLHPFASYEHRIHPTCRVPPYTINNRQSMRQFQVPSRDPNHEILRFMANFLASHNKPQITPKPTIPSKSPCHDVEAGCQSPEQVPKTPCLSPTPSSSPRCSSPRNSTLREREASSSPEQCPVTPSHSNPDSDADRSSDPDEPLDLSQGKKKSQEVSIRRVEYLSEPPTPPKELNLSPFLSMNTSNVSTNQQLKTYLRSLTPNLNGTNQSTSSPNSEDTRDEFEITAPIIQPAYISWQASSTYCPQRKLWINRRKPTVIPLPVNRFENFADAGKEESKAEAPSNCTDEVTSKDD